MRLISRLARPLAAELQQNGLLWVAKTPLLYSAPMSKIENVDDFLGMAKPEEVLIVEDENGNIVRETLKDNDVLVQYKNHARDVDLLGRDFGPQRYRATNVGKVEQSIEFAAESTCGTR